MKAARLVLALALAAGHEPQPSSPEELSQRYAAWIGRFTKVANAVGLKPQ